jgi:signal transduction histidine kinase
LSLINDIVEISKIASGLTRINLSTFGIHHLIDEIIQNFVVSELRAEGVEILKESNLKPEEGYITSDVNKLKLIINNLVSNALKNTFEGFVSIIYNIKAGSFLEIVVKDTGIGIPQEYHKLIFERFRQIETKQGNVQRGTGLGLSIVNAYVKILKGSISLDSEPGKGTLFTVKIPFINK